MGNAKVARQQGCQPPAAANPTTGALMPLLPGLPQKIELAPIRSMIVAPTTLAAVRIIGSMHGGMPPSAFIAHAG